MRRSAGAVTLRHAAPSLRERPAAGWVAHPRVEQNVGERGAGEQDGPAGLVAHPRDGRAGLGAGGELPGDGEGRMGRAGDVLAALGLGLTAVTLGIVLAVVAFSTIWLMVGADDGNLTQSMSIRTWVAPGGVANLGPGLVWALFVVALCRLAWGRGRALDGPCARRALVAGTFVVQVVIILALQARDTYWGDSWMVSDFVRAAVDGGIPSIFRGPYRTLFYDARLYFSCYPFQATLFWMMYGLRLVFGDASFMVYQLISAAATSLGVWALLDLARLCCRDARGQRVAWVLVALCAPMYLLSMFLYGNAMGCGLALAFLALQARAMSAGGREAAAWCAASLAPLAAALCVKATFVLFAIGALLAWFVLALVRRQGWGLVGCVAVVAVAHALSGLPFDALAAASGGYEFGGSLTTLNHLELGLRMGAGEFYVSVDDGPYEYAPGGWSNHSNAVWLASGENADVQNEVATHELAADVLAFAKHPGYAVRFFAVKLATEWADPAYQSLYYLSMCGNAAGVRVNPADTSTPLGAASSVLIDVLDGYQTVTFAAALGAAVLTCRRWGRGGVRNAAVLLLAAVFFTGFGCYLLWEAKAVYVLPFAIVALLLSSVGLSALFRYTEGLFPHRRDTC